MSNEKIGDRIGKLLKESNLTQKELANMVGATEASISRYISNDREPKMEVIANLATAFNTTTDYLIKGTKENEDFAKAYKLVARGAKNMNDEDKIELVRILLKK